ncbi:hypothetical protein BDZ89DRAFT_1165341 [Hymenopellis radicata]|nr:hypothetical protein BDZ89DRAFT_1165341 [Hymenopellis radicata]
MRGLRASLMIVLVNVSTYLILDGSPASLRPSSKRVQIALSLCSPLPLLSLEEVALYLGPLALQALFLRWITFTGLFKLVWPEFSGIYFNVVLGKKWRCRASLRDWRLRRLLLPPLCFMGIISALGHKEWRFIVYVVPMVNVAAAVSSKWMAGLAKNRLAGKILYAGTFGLVLLQAAMTYTHTVASIANYPGGEALKIFNDNATARTHIESGRPNWGILFLQEHEKWIYNKTENISMADLFASQTFTHLISEPVSKVPKSWMVADTVEAFDGWRWRRHETLGCCADVEKHAFADYETYIILSSGNRRNNSFDSLAQE